MSDTRVANDEDGRWLVSDGKYLRDDRGNKIPPQQSTKVNDGSGFTTYETSQGHCGLCGSLSCNGGCFK